MSLQHNAEDMAVPGDGQIKQHAAANPKNIMFNWSVSCSQKLEIYRDHYSACLG